MPTPPDGLWSALDPGVPVALLPVRLETRFGTRPVAAADGTLFDVPVLRVRIYPDDISVVPATAGLRPVERSAGAEFWTAQSDPETAEEAAIPGAFDHRRRAAWEVLVRRVGSARAVFVAQASHPDAPLAPDRVDVAPTARLLPDGWVISGYLGGRRVFAEFVARTEGDPQIGPSRSPDSDAFDPADPLLVHPADGLRWLTDFDAALAIGMAAVIDLATVEDVQAGVVSDVATHGLDTLVAVGVREPSAARPVEGEAQQFADLLTTHASADRLAFVAQGTATNNLTDRASGWSSTADVFAGYARVVDPTAPAGLATGVSALGGGAEDGVVFESAFGLPAALTAGIDGAGGHEQWLARNMALTLFPVTIGEVIGTLSRPARFIVSDQDQERFLDQLDTALPFAREHTASFVRGRGPVPTVRIGRQPYGVLPILPFARWRPSADEPAQLTRLADILRVLRPFWERAAGGVATIRPGTDPTAELVKILGLAAVPHPGGYRVRNVTGRLAGTMVMMASPPSVQAVAGSQIARELAGAGLISAQVQLTGYRHLLALTLDDLVDGTQLEALLLAGEKPLRVAVARTDPNRHGWETPATYLKRLASGMVNFRLPELLLNETRPTDLLFVLAEHALALAGELDAFRLLGALSGAKLGQALAVSPEVSDTGLKIAAPVHQAFTAAAADLVSEHVALPQELAAVSLPGLISEHHSALIDALRLPKLHLNGFAGTRAAVSVLAGAGLDDDGYTRLVGETLACATTRLDAWFTSLAAQRLATLRERRPDGLQLGAWGVLADVRPRVSRAVPAEQVPADWTASPGGQATVTPLVQPPVQVGYVHAPSLAQARTAGVLRAGELAHGGDASSLAAIDLTSARVRIAREIIESMSYGQPLGALLGYRLERLLGDAGMWSELAALRAAFPQRRVTGNPGEPAAGTDSVVPDEVVDGLEVWQSPNTVAVANPADRPAFDAIIAELGRAVEAVADLIVAEGVHQITSGRPDSAGATFTAVAEGTQLPEVAVVREPRSGITITHRIALLLDDAAPGAPGWDRTAPRAVLAPAAELWAESVLGAASNWTIPVGAVAVSLDVLGLCGLDVLVESRATGDSRTLLAQRLAGAGIAAGADPGAEVAADDETFARLTALAQAGADVLIASRPATAADLTAPPQADNPDAGTVVAIAAPAAADLQPLADEITAQLDILTAAIEAVIAAATGLDPAAELDAALLTPFARAGLPGSILPAGPAGTVPLADVVGAASAAAAVLRDVDALIDQGLANPPADTARPVRLSAICATDTGLSTLVKIVRRIGGDAVLATRPVVHGLGDALVAEQEPVAVETWLARLGRVRTASAAYDDLRLFTEALGTPSPSLRAFQFPRVDAEGWVGDPLPAAPGGNELRAWARPDSPRVHLVAAGDFEAAGPAVNAVIVDEVVEVLPAPTVTTGLAIHYDAPNARPPQTVLLAVHPDPATAWSWPLLEEVAREALALSRLRGVDLDDLAATGIDEYLPLTYVRDGLSSTTPLSELTKGFEWLKTHIAANRVNLGVV